VSTSTKHLVALIVGIAGPAILAGLLAASKLKPEWAWLGVVTPILANLIQRLETIDDEPPPPPPVAGAAILLFGFTAALVSMQDACTPAQEAAASSLGLCVAGVVEKDWGQPPLTVTADAVAACASLLPPILTVLDETGAPVTPPTPAQRLAPIIAAAQQLIALEHIGAQDAGAQ
jgi:hypothetical protein